MTITINLPPETEKKLRSHAAESGLAPDVLAQHLIEQGLNGASERAEGTSRGAALHKILTPFREEVQASGMTDEELRDLFTEARDDARSEKRAKRAQG